MLFEDYFCSATSHISTVIAFNREFTLMDIDIGAYYIRIPHVIH